MMKFVNLLRRKEGMTHEQFLDYWQNHHAQLALKHADAIRMRRYIQLHPGFPSVVDAINAPRDMGSAVDVGYDGIVECWWDSEEDFFAGMQSEEGQKAWAEIAADEPNFSDFSHAYTFVGEEVLIFDRTK
ncbi:EthD domain-containing protein [Streptomyces sp. NPDC047081]|uniref:EthD domain-containing protein n=1 Tax=Streptomyces sp. NPDC047081 TaxID=3154706 RepID=UPI0034048FC4